MTLIKPEAQVLQDIARRVIKGESLYRIVAT